MTSGLRRVSEHERTATEIFQYDLSIAIDAKKAEVDMLLTLSVGHSSKRGPRKKDNKTLTMMPYGFLDLIISAKISGKRLLMIVQ